MERPRVIFAYREGHRNSGAKLMRVDQLSAMANAWLGEKWAIETLALPRPGQRRAQRQMTDHIRGATIIFLKRSIDTIDLDILWKWRDAAHAIGIDYVDAETNPWPKIPIDLHIAASGALEKHLSKRLHERPELARSHQSSVVRVDHHADPALAELAAPRPLDALRLTYFGRPSNCTLPDSAAKRVHLPEYVGLALEENTRQLMAKANMHYAVRDMSAASERTSFKPFTKGFTAAACGAQILVNRQVDDAIEFLGSDYPFLINDCSPDTIASAIDRAESAVGTPLWDEALERMAQVARQISPRNVTSQLDDALTSVSPRCETRSALAV